MHEFPIRDTYDKDESLLKGKLVERKWSKTTETEKDTPVSSQLRGKLLSQANEREGADAHKLVELRGSLSETESQIPFSDEWLRAHAYIQRDGGKSYIVIDIADSKYGKRIQLKNLSEQSTITLDVASFIEKLQRAGSPWRVEEST